MPVWRSYDRIRRLELNVTWEQEKVHKRKKLRNMAGRMLKSNVEGILLGDEDLQRLFGEPETNGLVLGGIEATENMLEFLKLDPKFKVFEKISKLEFETQVETTAYKQRMSRQEDSGQVVQQQERLRHRAEQQRQRETHSEGKVDFTRVRAGDAGFTKRMAQPANLPERERRRKS